MEGSVESPASSDEYLRSPIKILRYYVRAPRLVKRSGRWGSPVRMGGSASGRPPRDKGGALPQTDPSGQSSIRLRDIPFLPSPRWSQGHRRQTTRPPADSAGGLLLGGAGLISGSARATARGRDSSPSRP